MNNKSAGWILFIAAMGMMCTLLSFDLAKLISWDEAMKPAFIAILMAHLGTVITAFIGGKLIPTDRDISLRERSSDNT